ncbi:MAG: hypothetical protein QOI05_3372 [Bradyrhizobium sp.]|jgi:hypothetical protein|nr:hypothetical protein [Bradyrhizobium sp.]
MDGRLNPTMGPNKNPGREAGVFGIRRCRRDQYLATTGELKW